MDENAKELFERETKAFNNKSNLDALNQELALNFYPESADFTTERCLGEEFAIDLFDGEPVRCRRDLGNARASMLRPRGQEWCRIETEDKRINEAPAVSRFLDWMNNTYRAKLYHHDSGFVDCEKTADMDVVTFGGAVKTAESEVARDGRRILLTRRWHLRDCAWFDDLTGVRQDTMFRRFKASARHIKKMFPGVELAGAIKDACEKEPDREFNLCHVMMPADDYSYFKRPRGKKTKWVSIYYDSDHKMLLRERPSERFRYVVDRWQRIPGSQYPYSPAATTTLPDARGIQAMAMVLLEAGEKAVDPPTKATRNAVLGEIDLGAAGVTWVDKEYDERMGPAIEPLLPPNQNISIGIDLINRTTFALRSGWFLDKLSLPQSPAKTAYETSVLVEEFIRANIPLFEPWEAGEAMMLEEIFFVMMDMGVFGKVADWPRELSGGELAFKFSNPLQDAIERNRVNQANVALGIMAGAGEAAQAAQAPGVRRIDLDKMVEDAVRGTGAPAEWIKDEDQAEAEQQQVQQESDIVKALNGAGAAADVANQGLDAALKLQGLTQPAAANGEMMMPV